MKKILYLHGRGSKPGGTKPKFLQSLGYDVINPHLPDESFDMSINIAKDAIQIHQPDVVVGSSRGGAVALASANPDTKLVLMCPAWKHFNVTVPENLQDVTVLHAEEDKIVSHEDSIRLIEKCDAVLITCGENHRMIDNVSLNTLEGVLLTK